ncbi:hypothetical protein NC652_041792 [Populus alba x Populus x berolinensis]|nr:hypothetical protein NC652_041792 [Populus alba x Populus x berolinensis]
MKILLMSRLVALWRKKTTTCLTNNLHDPMERALYWESQDALLQGVLERYSSIGSKLRQEHLFAHRSGKNTRKHPGGKHEYVEIIAGTVGRKKPIPYLIELEFRDQFEIAKASDEYRNLVALLPEYYVGKADYLNAIVGILCDAAKRSMKEKKIHMGPWRKRSFMQMKWSNCSERRSVDKSSGKSFPSSRQAHESCLHLSAAPALTVT